MDSALKALLCSRLYGQLCAFGCAVSLKLFLKSLKKSVNILALVLLFKKTRLYSVVQAGSDYVAEANLKVKILLPLPSEPGIIGGVTITCLAQVTRQSPAKRAAPETC